MPMNQNILSPHHKVLDFFNRTSDIFFLGISLLIAIEFNDKDWTQTATVLFLFSIIYSQLSASLTGMYESQRSLGITKV
ncbi:hypothetical protein, partial [uncultured Agitococcus sp.]|uniref:hypothetical protein n=1 Tax=uncultured Agitococcus sp. TaxID=1506599 RepID=UPI0026173E08